MGVILYVCVGEREKEKKEDNPRKKYREGESGRERICIYICQRSAVLILVSLV